MAAASTHLPGRPSSPAWRGPAVLLLGAVAVGGAVALLSASATLLLAAVVAGLAAAAAWHSAGRAGWAATILRARTDAVRATAPLDAFAWWMHPAWQVAATAGTSAALAWWVPAATFASNWGTLKLFNAEDALRSLALIGCFAGASLMCARTTRRTADVTLPAVLARIDGNRLHIACRWLFWGTVFGYVVWFAVGAMNGVVIADVAAVLDGRPGAIRGLKTRIQPIAGLTTFTQLGGPAVAALYVLSLMRPDLRAPIWRRLAVLLVLAGARAVLHAERLALVELIVPLAVVWLATRATPATRSPRLRRLRLALLPAAALAGLTAFFGALEYIRSWSNYHQFHSGSSYVDFVVARLAGYYATAANNTILLTDHLTAHLEVPFYTLEWLWRSPLVAAFGGYPGGVDPDERWRSVLHLYGNPEFNNQGGLLLPTADLGPVGGVLFWIAAGCAAGVLFANLRRRTPMGLFVTPLMVIGYLETPRFLYWSLGRALPVIVAGVMLARYVAVRGQDQRSEPDAGDHAARTIGAHP